MTEGKAKLELRYTPNNGTVTAIIYISDKLLFSCRADILLGDIIQLYKNAYLKGEIAAYSELFEMPSKIVNNQYSEISEAATALASIFNISDNVFAESKEYTLKIHDSEIDDTEDEEAYLNLASRINFKVPLYTFFDAFSVFTIENDNQLRSDLFSRFISFLSRYSYQLPKYDIQSYKATDLFDVLYCNASELSYIYYCNSSDDIVLSILHYLCMQNIEIKYCEECGRLFSPANKTDEKYCRRIYNGRECRHIANNKIRLKRMTDIDRKENSTGTNLAKRCEAKKIEEWQRAEREEIFDRFKKERKVQRNRYRNNEISEEEYSAWLDTWKVGGKNNP